MQTRDARGRLVEPGPQRNVNTWGGRWAIPRPRLEGVVEGGLVAALDARYLLLTGGRVTGPLTVAALEVLSNNMHIARAGDAADARLLISSDAGRQAMLYLRSGGSQRWQVGKNTTAEVGGDSGSDFALIPYSDAGVPFTAALVVSRATQVAAFLRIPTAGGVAVATLGANVFTAVQEVTQTGSTETALRLVNSNAGGIAAPSVFLWRNSASPAAGDQLARLQFLGQDSGLSATIEYATVRGGIVSAVNGSTQGKLEILTAPTSGLRLTVGQGVAVGSAADMGVNSLNAGTLYEGGVALSTKYVLA